MRYSVQAGSAVDGGKAGPMGFKRLVHFSATQVCGGTFRAVVDPAWKQAQPSDSSVCTTPLQGDGADDDDADSLYSVPAPTPAVLTFPKDDVSGWLRAFNAQDHNGGGSFGGGGGRKSSSSSGGGEGVASSLVLQAATARPGALLVLAAETGAQQQLW